MPIYEYLCPSCGKINEVLQKNADAAAPAKCPSCGKPGLKKKISRPSVHISSGGGQCDSACCGSDLNCDNPGSGCSAPGSCCH